MVSGIGRRSRLEEIRSRANGYKATREAAMAAFAREELAEGDRPIELPTAGNPAVAFVGHHSGGGFRGPFLQGGWRRRGRESNAPDCAGVPGEKAPHGAGEGQAI